MALMGQWLALSQLRTDLLALESRAAQAGCALACPFSCSDELEAALVRSRLAAGTYGPKLRRRRALYVGLVVGTLAILLWSL